MEKRGYPRWTLILLTFFLVIMSASIAVRADKKEKDDSEAAAEEVSETEFTGGHLKATDSTNRQADTEEEEEKNQKKLPHGTADHLIKATELNLSPPKDYTVDDSMQAKPEEGLYDAYFLKEDIQKVSIEIDENNLNYMLQNAADKPTVMTKSVTIGDKTIGYAGIKTKGSYTLQHSVTEGAGSDRFSFTINFGKYIKKESYGKKQNFFGASKICFNNFFFDKSMMKEYFALRLFDEMGLPAPQYGLARVYVNGAYYGVFSMIEALDAPLLSQYMNVDKDEISPYFLKPEQTSLLDWQIDGDESLLWEQDKDTYADVKEMIPTVKTWVKKLNQLSQGKDFSGKKIDVNSDDYLKMLESIMDVDEAVKYYAVHSFLCQLDSYFNGMKNYGLYVDRKGKSLVVPWDYDLSFGCFFPGESESTANYDIDVMYRAPISETVKNGGFEDLSENYYKDYPLFNVIYQNKSLMEKYHAYLKDCSRVAALGGTIYNGETYDPCYFHSYIDKLCDKVVEAAGEKLADNVYYMNGINQPLDAATAYTNLAKIIALRSVGVMLQTEGEKAIVSGNGCNLGALGNAFEGYCLARGRIASVDADTGIFVIGDYTASATPGLTLRKITESDEQYLDIAEKTGCGRDDSMLIYQAKDTGMPMKGYELNIPLSRAYADEQGEIEFYTYKDGQATKLDMKKNDNLYSGNADQLSYIVIIQKGGNLAVAQAGDSLSASAGGGHFWVWRLLGAALLMAAGMAAVLIWKKKLGTVTR